MEARVVKSIVSGMLRDGIKTGCAMAASVGTWEDRLPERCQAIEGT